MASTHRQEQMDERFARHLRESRQNDLSFSDPGGLSSSQLKTTGESLLNGLAAYPADHICYFQDPLSFPNDYDNWDDLGAYDSANPGWLHPPVDGVYMVNAWHGWTTAADDGVTPMVTRGAVLMSASGTSLDPPWTPWSFYSTVYILGDADDGMTVFREAAYSGLALLRSYDWLQLAISAGALDGSDSSSSHDGRLGLTLLYTV